MKLKMHVNGFKATLVNKKRIKIIVHLGKYGD